MRVQTQFPLPYSNQYSTDSACWHCGEVIRHEPWCITQNLGVLYAYQVVSDPSHLSPADHLILHALSDTAETLSWFPDQQPTGADEVGDPAPNL
jgi:hypothetical protein